MQKTNDEKVMQTHLTDGRNDRKRLATALVCESKFNKMVIHSSYPSKNFPLLVQINYGDGSVAFYPAESIEDAIASYLGNIVAIFKPKMK